MGSEDIEVTHDDQIKINTFATWNLKFNDYKLEYEEKKKDLANYNDAEDELVILDDETHPYMIGETFFHLGNDQITEELNLAKEKIKARIVDLEDKIGDCKVKMNGLRKELYGKFGNNINLEEE